MSNATPVTMTPPSGTAPTVVNFPDATSVSPNDDGTFTVAANFVNMLLAAGWSIQVTSGTTHVP